MSAWIFLILVSISNAAVVERSWVVRSTVVAPDGFPRHATVVQDVNASPSSATVPGPTLTVREGDSVIVHVRNNLPTEEITIHWHGLHMKNQVWQDGTLGITQCGISAQAVQTFRFDITQGPGTHWYHSHVASQTMDGLQGMVIILPRKTETDPIKDRFKYVLDHELSIMDWAHEISSNLDTHYLTPTHKYASSKDLFLPDYPWPSYGVLIGGRGQTDCIYYSWEDCQTVREVGWPHFLNNSIPKYYGEKPLPKIDGKLQKTYGQCMPSRPPLQGQCNPNAEPAKVKCIVGENIRLRLLNSGFSMPLRFWIDRHQMTVVMRDGVELEPNGPHSFIVVAIGQRLDVIVKCGQDGKANFKMYAMVALSETYPGAQAINFEAFSYAIIEYDPNAQVDEPARTPRQLFPSAYKPASIPGLGAMYREQYKDWGFDKTQFIPQAIQNALRPRQGSKWASAPAAIEQRFLSVNGEGNWWNNVSNAHSDIDKCQEWWLMTESSSWSEQAGKLLATPSVPLLVSRFYSPAPSGSQRRQLSECPPPTKEPPLQVNLEYNATSPKTYEFVIINFESQQHPFHTHGYTLQFIGTGWLYPSTRWKSRQEEAGPDNFMYDWRGESRQEEATPYNFTYNRTQWNLPAYNESVKEVMTIGDTFVMPPRSFTVFRITADNPGAWLMHCHMDFHLLAGQGFIWSVEPKDGSGLGFVGEPEKLAMCSSLPTDTMLNMLGVVNQEEKSTSSAQSSLPPLYGVSIVSIGNFLLVYLLLSGSSI